MFLMKPKLLDWTRARPSYNGSALAQATGKVARRCRGWGAEGPAQPVGLRARANSLGTRKLLAAQRSFGGAIGELEQFPHDRVAA